MPLLLVALFIVVPLIEIVAINQVQALLGWPLTILILVADSILGAYLVRLQGALAWRRLTEAFGEARLPAEEIVDGALILFGGALLLTPGFVTDGVGLALVFTPSRKALNRLVRRRVEARPGAFGTIMGLGSRRGRGRPDARGDEPGPVSPPPRPTLPGVIDVEVVDVRRTPPEEGRRLRKPTDGPRA